MHSQLQTNMLMIGNGHGKARLKNLKAAEALYQVDNYLKQWKNYLKTL